MARQVQGREPKRSSLVPWLALAAAAHLGLLLATWVMARNHRPRAAVPVDSVTDPIWLDLVATDSTDARALRDDTASNPDVTDAPPTPAAPAPAGESLPKPRAPGSIEPSGAEAASVASASPTPGAPEATAGSGAAGDGGSAPGSGPRLSLRDLGVDRGSNPFIGSVSELPTERQLLNQRLRQSLRSEIAKQDQARGLGPEGPAVTAVTEIVMASATAPNTTALLRVRADGAGKVTQVDVLEADRDGDEWNHIARELVRALAAKKLRVPNGSNGVSFQLRVVSRVQLPSGADPGLGIDLFGIPLKKGDGERSTKLSILSPVLREVEVPDSNGLRVPVPSFAIIAAAGDLADIGAVARRLVTAYLVAMETNPPPASVPPAPAPAAASSPGVAP